MGFSAKIGDVEPISATLEYKGLPFDLSLATSVDLRYRLQRATADTVRTCTIVSAPAGKVSYTFVAGDLVEPGSYVAEWVVHLPGGDELTFPRDAPFSFSVTARL